MLLLLILGVASILTAHADPLYPFGTGTLSPQSDDGSSPRINLLRAFTFFGGTHQQIYVNHNGHLTFDSAWSRFTAYEFPAHGSRDIIAPFWVDLDNRENGQIYYQQYTSGSILQRATQDINQYFPDLTFSASWVFVATWSEVAYYPRSGTRTTAQAVLITGGQYSFILLNYGIIAPTTRNVQAGYDTVNSVHHFSVPGSYPNDGASNSYSIFRQSSNVNVAGRWAFRTDHGQNGCTFNGLTVQQGYSFWADNTCRQRCTCTAAGLQCHDQPCTFSQTCQSAAFQFACRTAQRKTCTIAGDPHYYTFDGTVFHFQGTCTYVLSEQCGGTLPYYRVEGKNEHRGSTRVSWTRLVKVFVYGQEIELVKGHRAEAKVNGSFVAAPLSLNDGKIQIYQSGFHLAVSTDFGLLVTYDANHLVRISVTYNYFNATCGLCGNFNNRRVDDLRTRQGVVVDSDVVFANSWQAVGDDEPGCEARCGGLSCAACTQAQTSLYSNVGHCGIVRDTSGPFAACHNALPPTNFVDSCVYDMCVGDGYQPILCQALNVYASQCQQLGIQPGSWRRPGFCEIPCPANSHFESQGTSCPATCTNPDAPTNCPIPTQEGCICDSGFVLSAGVCVPRDQCGCTFEERYYGLGQTVILDENCGRRCTCTQNSMSCQSNACSAQETCTVEDGVRGCRPISYRTCWVNGPSLYRTFDGLSYNYPGACELILARVMGLSPYPHFTVTAQKVLRDLHSFDRFLNFEAEGTHISVEIGGSSRVKVDGQLVQLPFSTASNQIHIYHSSVYAITLHTTFGVTVQTDWPHLVRLTAPGIYNGSLGGLCGNNNGHQHDDFRTPNGMLVNSSQIFGDSWRDGSLSAHCVERGHDGEPEVVPTTTDFYSDQYCGIIASQRGPFRICSIRLEAWDRVEECVRDMRESGGATEVLCEALRDHALRCQQIGVVIGDWRNETGCEQTCPFNSHYELCGTSCPSTCPSLSFPFSCATVCQEGCQCDDGFLLSGNRCVRTTGCGCFHNGHYREGGEQFWDGDDCQSFCTCDGTTGLVHCAQNSCGPQETCSIVDGEFGCHPSPRGSCSASGDPHYLTFDGVAYDFQGTCRYVLATLCTNTSGLHHFQVEGKNEPLSRPVSITAEVFVDVWGHRVHMSRGQHGVVEVDGVITNLPILLDGGRVSIYASGFRVFVNADFGLRVSYDGSSVVSISVPSNYSGQTCGLCGNFNGNRNDEFLDPAGVSLSSPSLFGAAWKVAGDPTCYDGCGSSCPTCTNEAPARTQCDVIRSSEGPLSFCHEQVDPTPYFNDCVFDVCLLGDDGQDVLCRAIQAYVSACQFANVQLLPWRQSTPCAVECPANSHYELCGTDCGHTCASSIDASCEQVCSEGCFCDNGFLRSGGQCVPMENCGCQYDGFSYDIGELFWTPGCSQQCQCYAPNDVRCTDTSCTSTQECTIRHGRRGCFDALSTCTVWGDPHYVSFDGAVTHFQGTCSYIVAESTSHDTCEIGFQVVATNNHRGNNRVSFVSAVDIYLRNEYEQAHIRIGNSRRVTVNGIMVLPPTSAGTLADVVIEGRYAVVSNEHLSVQYDGRSTLLVRVGQCHQNAVTGMCGNSNGNPADDKVLPDGSTAQNDNEFGDGWKSSTSQMGCGATDVRDEDGECRYREEYSNLCSIITNTTGPFSACHLHSDPQPYFQSCVYDLCLYTPANGMLCAAVSAYERTCSVLGLDIPQWRPDLLCAETDPCEAMNCTDDEWCGEKHEVYGCFCDEHHHRPNNESYDSSITCESSTGTMSVSRCQLFEAGFHPEVLHLTDSTCRGILQGGNLVFHFDNDAQQCGTALSSNGTHFIYQNSIRGDADTHGGLISRERNIHLRFCCEYPLSQSVSMGMAINPVESIISKKLPTGQGHYRIIMTPFTDASYRYPLTSEGVINVEVNQRLYVEVRTEGVDERQIATILDSCWATPEDDANHPVRWDLIINECPNTEDGTVLLTQNGVSTAARFSFKMFTFTDFFTLYLHCRVHLCLHGQDDCTAHCYPGYHQRTRRDTSIHDTAALSMGPLRLEGNHDSGHVKRRSPSRSDGPSHLASIVVLLFSFFTANLLF